MNHGGHLLSRAGAESAPTTRQSGHLWEHNEWEAREILFAMDRIPRSLWDYQDIGRIHLALCLAPCWRCCRIPIFKTGCTEPWIAARCSGICKITGSSIFSAPVYHPVLPLIPPADWEAHLDRWQRMARHLFFAAIFRVLAAGDGVLHGDDPCCAGLGYRFVLVDCEHVRPVTPMSWQELRYRPHIARFGGEIVVIVRDRELSNAQESGMGWSGSCGRSRNGRKSAISRRW